MTHPSARTIAIGDVHGCAHALDALLEAIQPQPADHLVFLGDLVDQGRDSAAVLNCILELPKQCRVTLIEGNHEEMMLAARDSEKSLRYWENCGGVATLNSYKFGARLAEIPEKHWELLHSGLPFLETDDVIFTHANYQPDVAMPDQESFHLRWELFEPDEMQPHYSGKTVVVGHTEQKNSEIRDLGFAICIDTACWRYGWLTAFDVHSRVYWQASRWGILREEEEPTHRGLLPQFARAC